MADHTPIEWTDATWNPITGCTLVSEGCRHCYAATLAATRLRNIPSRKGLARINAAGEAKFTGEVRLNEDWLDQPLRWKKPRRIFVCAHGDLFHEAVPDEWIDRVFAVMALAPQHTFQVLTKRPERAREYSRNPMLLDGWRRAKVPHPSLPGEGSCAEGWELLDFATLPETLPNVWLGTSVEDQAAADARIPHLLATPAAVRFLSAEPLLGPISLGDMCDGVKFIDVLRGNWWHDCEPPHIESGKPRLDWVIVGGESGRHARPMHPDWARSLRDQCVAAGVAFFFKQWGAWGPSTTEEAESNPRSGWRCLKGHPHVPKTAELYPEAGAAFVEHKGKSAAGRFLDGREWNQMPGMRDE